MITPDAFDTAFTAWLAGCQTKIADYYATHFPTNEVPNLTVTKGQRYWRVVTRRRDDTGSVYCFVEPATGNVLKADGWKAPARNGVRGNLFDNTAGLGCMDWHGCIYIR